MEQIPEAEVERAMRMQDVMVQAIAKKITWWQAAEILGMSPRTLRRWRVNYQRYGFRAMFDGRKRKPNWRRAPIAEVERVLQLYRDTYYDLNVRHFHEKLVEEYEIRWSYTWLKNMLQAAGLVKRSRSRSKHRKRRPR